MRRALAFVLAVVQTAALCGCSSAVNTKRYEKESDMIISDTKANETGAFESLPDLKGFESSFEAAANMKIGWNLGNSLDSSGNIKGTAASDFETAWGNPVTVPELIASVKDAGFNSVRIPVTWWCNMNNDGTVNDFWLDRVEEVVNYALDEDMYAIINVHHDTGGSEEAWLRADPLMYEEMSQRYAGLWRQIADRFKDYGDKLLFEGFNEILDSSFNWNGSGEEEYAVVNRLNQLFVDTVRASGGNNPERNIIVSSYGASTAQPQTDGFRIPSDTAQNHLIAEMHCYDPWAFTSNGGDTTWDEEDKKVLEGIFERINRKVTKEQGVPLIIGEFAAQDAENTEERAAYAGDFIRIAKKYGITCYWWDDGGSMAIIDRTLCEISQPEIVSSMMEALRGN